MGITHNLSIFISHDTSDKVLALLLKEFLEGLFLNASVFVSSEDLHGGDVWIEALRESLQYASVILPVITPRSMNNRWVLFEAGAGFCDRRTIPILADGVAFETLDAPFRFLQARLYNEDGLKQLVSDIAQRTGLRTPNNYPGLEHALERAKQFLSESKKSQELPDQSSHISSTTPSSFFKPPDPEIHSMRAKLDARFKKVLVKVIGKARGAFELPSPEELEKMSVSDLWEVGQAVAAPVPTTLMLKFMSLDGGAIPSIEASSWRKINAKKQLEEMEKELVEYEKGLS